MTIAEAPAPDSVTEFLERARYRGDPVAWDAIVGHEPAKRELRVIAAQLRRHSVAERLGLTLVKGLIILGPPGTGKTMLAKALASAVERPAYLLPSAELNPERIREVYEALADQPSVVIIDEADTILRDRWLDGDARLAASFCMALDAARPAHGPITVALTAEPERRLDDSALRAGRLTTKVRLSHPEAADRRAMWERSLARVPVSGDIDLDAAVEASEMSTGADIESFVMVALGLALVDGTDAVTDALLAEALGRDNRVVDPVEPRTPPVDQWIEAIHETGHAIWAIRLFGDDAIKSIALGGGPPRAPHTALADSAQPRIRTRGYVRKRVQVHLAGMVAEELEFGPDGVSEGCAHDLQAVTELLRRLLGEAGASTTFGPIQAQLVLPQPPQWLDERLWSEVLHEAREGLATVRAGLAGDLDLIRVVAQALHDAPDRSLTGAEVVALLAGRPVR